MSGGERVRTPVVTLASVSLRTCTRDTWILAVAQGLASCGSMLFRHLTCGCRWRTGNSWLRHASGLQAHRAVGAGPSSQKRDVAKATLTIHNKQQALPCCGTCILSPSRVPLHVQCQNLTLPGLLDQMHMSADFR